MTIMTIPTTDPTASGCTGTYSASTTLPAVLAAKCDDSTCTTLQTSVTNLGEFALTLKPIQRQRQRQTQRQVRLCPLFSLQSVTTLHAKLWRPTSMSSTQRPRHRQRQYDSACSFWLPSAANQHAPLWRELSPSWLWFFFVLVFVFVFFFATTQHPPKMLPILVSSFFVKSQTNYYGL